jgi:succinate dehydrogenase hydrophobic anchor subunit
MMSEQASGKLKFGIGHWVALGAAALTLVLLLIQLILFFTTKPKAGAVINALVHTGLLAVLVAAAVVALLMARRNVRLNVLVFVLAGVVFLLAPHNATSETLKTHVVTFYLLVCVLAFVVGTLMAGRVLVLPTSADVRGMKAGLGGSAAPKPAPAKKAEKAEEEKDEDEPGSVPLA